MIDGQDNNNFGVAGSTIPLNNPDAIQEVQTGHEPVQRRVRPQRERRFQRDHAQRLEPVSRFGFLVSQRQRAERLQQHAESGRQWFLQSKRDR